MSTVVGALEIQLLADVARLQKDMQSVKRSVDSTMIDIQRMAGGATAALGALGIGFSAVAAVGFVNGVIEANAALDDMAEITGASVESLSALRQVARVSGQDMESVAGAMTKLAKGLSGVDDESKGAGKALDALGLDVQEFKALKADEQMVAVAKALNEFEDGSNKAAVAQALFGKSGAALLPYLKDLAEWGELNATVTAEQAAEAEALQKNMARLKSDLQDTGNTLVGQLVPYLQLVVGEFRKAQQGADDFGASGGALKTIAETLIVLWSEVSFVFRGVGTELGGIAAQIAMVAQGEFAKARAIGEAMKEDAAIARAEHDKFIASVMNLDKKAAATTGMPSATKKMLEFSSAANKAGKAAKEAADKWRLADNEQSTLSVVDRNMFAATGTTFELADARDKEEIKQREEHRKAVEAIVAQTESGKLELQRKSMIEAAAMFQEGALTEVQWLEYAAEQNKRFTEKTKDEFGELEQAINGWARSSADAIVDFVSGTKTNFGDMVDSILKDIARLTVNEYLTKPLFSGLTASMKGSSGGSSGGGFGDLFGGLGKLLGLGGSGYGDVAGVAAGVPQYAVGTDYVPRDGLAMIHRGERIVPAAQNTPESRQNITVNVSVPAGSPAETRRAAGQGAREALAALSGARRYG